MTNEPSDRSFVESLYRQFLGRDPDPAGLAHFVGLLHGGKSRHEIADEISTSQEAVMKGTLSNEAFVKVLCRDHLGRKPEPGELEALTSRLAAGTQRDDMAQEISQSREAVLFRQRWDMTEAMHEARRHWIMELPAARRILDLGGNSNSNPLGALVEMGYPHAFDELTIVELPPPDRHELYRTPAMEAPMRAPPPNGGVVRYLYRSMANLADVPDSSFDLVVSGQTFEHVTPEDGERVLSEAFRVLKNGGHLALDTPNRVATAIQLQGTTERFINPDHKIEYTHPQMVMLLERHGFRVLRQRALNYIPLSISAGVFDDLEVIRGPRQHDDIENGYMLAYLAKKPLSS